MGDALMKFADTMFYVCLAITDPFLDWLLCISRDWAIFIIAVATSAILTFFRLFTTNQELLGRCNNDKKLLKKLTKEAKKTSDNEAVTRYRATMAFVAMKLMKAEGKPLLAAILPIALLGTWCWARIGFYPPKDGEKVELKAYFDAASIGKIAHLVPQQGIKADQWIKRVEEDPVKGPGGRINGLVVWKIKGKKQDKDEPYILEIRYVGKTYEREFEVGTKHYSAAFVFHNLKPDDRLQCTELAMKPFWFWGKLHIPWWGLDAFIFPWLLAYIMIAVPFVFILKRIFGIH